MRLLPTWCGCHITFVYAGNFFRARVGLTRHHGRHRSGSERRVRWHVLSAARVLWQQTEWPANFLQHTKQTGESDRAKNATAPQLHQSDDTDFKERCLISSMSELWALRLMGDGSLFEDETSTELIMHHRDESARIKMNEEINVFNYSVYTQLLYIYRPIRNIIYHINRITSHINHIISHQSYHIPSYHINHTICFGWNQPSSGVLEPCFLLTCVSGKI
jgi:hypothetical protein